MSQDNENLNFPQSNEDTPLHERVEHYLQENQKSLVIILAAIIIIIGGYVVYKKMILNPKEQEALKEIYMAEKAFEQDSFRLAINGDGNMQGFNQIIEDYSITQTGNLAHYYKGISLMKLSKFEEAIDELTQYDAKDKFVASITFGAIADAYIEINNNEKAISFYKKAVASEKNELTTPIFMKKLALTYEHTNQLEEAKKIYEQLKSNYPKNSTSADIDKYITRVEVKMNL